MHKLWRHPNGTYYALYGPRLRSRVSTHTKDHDQAQIELARIIAADTGLTSETPTVGEILTAYRDDRLNVVRGKDGLKYGCKALIEHLGMLQPMQLTPSAIKNYVKNRDASDGTILREIGVLRAALAWAVEHRWITAAQNPPISNPVPMPPPRDRWITKDEARALLDGCVEPHVKMFVRLSVMTAARMGAILDAKWDQIDWERKIINFGPGHGNKRRAVVPINAELERALKAWREFNGGAFIIEWRGEGVATIKNGFKKACKRAGLKDVSPHVLRHSAATWMAMDGVPLREVAKMLGDSESTVERVYEKHTPEYLRRASGALQLGEGKQ